MIVKGVGLRPVGFSKYERVEYELNIPDETSKLLPSDGELVVPFYSNGRAGTVVPVKTITKTTEGGVTKHRFYGYYVVVDNNEIVEVLDAGVYERIYAERDKGIELGLPARVVKKFSELDKRELSELAAATPPEIVVALHAAGNRELVSKIVADMLHRDPLRITELPNHIIKQYLIDNDDIIVRTALLENTPMMIKILEEQLKSKGFVEADKLAIIYYRYWEEKLEDEMIEGAKRRWREHQHRERQQQRQTQLKAVVPLTVSMVSLTPPRARVADYSAEAELAEAMSRG